MHYCSLERIEQQKKEKETDILLILLEENVLNGCTVSNVGYRYFFKRIKFIYLTEMKRDVLLK